MTRGIFLSTRHIFPVLPARRRVSKLQFAQVQFSRLPSLIIPPHHMQGLISRVSKTCGNFAGRTIRLDSGEERGNVLISF